VNPDIRNAVLAVGLAFCILFGASALAAIVKYWGVSPRHVFAGFISLGIVALIGFGLLGALRNPPRR
jgi:hypothetical protein